MATSELSLLPEPGDPVTLAPERRLFTPEEKAEFARKGALYRAHRKRHEAMYPRKAVADIAAVAEAAPAPVAAPRPEDQPATCQTCGARYSRGASLRGEGCVLCGGGG